MRVWGPPALVASEVAGVSTGDSERQSLGSGTIEGSNRLDPHCSVAKQAATDQVGDRLRGKASSRHATSCPL